MGPYVRPEATTLDALLDSGADAVSATLDTGAAEVATMGVVVCSGSASVTVDSARTTALFGATVGA